MREVKKELDLARSRRDAIDQELEQTNVEVSESEDLIKSYKVMLQNSKSTVDIRTLIEKELPCREEELEKSKVDVARLSSDQLEVHGSMARLEIKYQNSTRAYEQQRDCLRIIGKELEMCENLVTSSLAHSDSQRLTGN